MKQNNYNLSINGLLSLLEEISYIPSNSKNNKGYIFGPLSKISPAWSPLLILIKNINPFLISKKIWPSQLNYFNGNVINDLKSSNSNRILMQNNLISLLEWTPFLSYSSEPIQTSLEKWSNSIYVDEQKIKNSLRLQGYDTIYIEEIIESQKMFLSYILTYHGELYANSVTHGLHTKNTPAGFSHMTSFIAATNDLYHLFHADLGMNIIENIRKNIGDKVAKMSNEEVLHWALQSGNSSKDSKKYKLRGLGSTIIKSCLQANENAKIYCITGSYMATISIDHNKVNELDENDTQFIKRINFIDEITICKIRKLKCNYPGTIWYLSIPTDREISKNDIKDVLEYIKVSREERNEEIKDFLI